MSFGDLSTFQAVTLCILLITTTLSTIAYVVYVSVKQNREAFKAARAKREFEAANPGRLEA